MQGSPVIVLITAPSKEIGKNIASSLVEQKLAACVNIVGPIESLYMWDGKIMDEEEVLLIVKTSQEGFQEVFIPAVRAVHPYNVPEIIAIPILDGDAPYLRWMQENSAGLSQTSGRMGEEHGH
jgi:periplasmic divalent cation tolerance protein